MAMNKAQRRAAGKKAAATRKRNELAAADKTNDPHKVDHVKDSR